MKIFPKIKTPVRRILESLKTEPEVKYDITYKVFLASTKDPETGRPVVTYTDVPITAIRLRHTDKSVGALGNVAAMGKGGSRSEVQAGDIVYIIEHADFPSGTSLKDKILTPDGVLESVKAITPIFEMLFEVTVESPSG